MTRIEPLSEATVVTAAAVEKACLETAWSESQLRQLPAHTVYLIALNEAGEVEGICSANRMGDEAELLNLAVLPEYRRQGTAGRLLACLFQKLSADGFRKLYLEVAETNLPAISLYRKYGFSEIGLRRGFYHGTDAVLMEKSLC